MIRSFYACIILMATRTYDQQHLSPVVVALPGTTNASQEVGG
jgi:hypothetical protein